MNIKVLHIVYALAHGGIENGLVNLVNKMSKEFSHVICSLTTSTNFKERIKNRNVKIIELNKKSGNDLFIPFKIGKIIKEEKVDIVHSRGWPTLVEGFLGAKLNRKPFIFGFHGKTYEEATESLKKRRILAQKLLIKFTKKVIILSPSLKESYLKELNIKDNSNFCVIRNGVDIERFNLSIDKNKKREELSIKPEDYLIGTVGRIDQVKDHSTLLKGFAMLIKEIPNLKLCIIGDGPYKNVILEESKKLGIKEKVIFLGMREDIPELLKIIDLYVQTSIYEGISNTLLEAIASKVPVIATNVGGTPDIIIDNQTGLLIPPKEPYKIKEAVLKLYNNYELRNKFVEAGFKKIEEEFSINSMIKNYEKLYIDLLN